VLYRRFKEIHGKSASRIQSYFRITKGGNQKKRCWEARGLSRTDQEALAVGTFSEVSREFTEFLDAWKQIEDRLG
jgi:hypothetical protein